MRPIRPRLLTIFIFAACCAGSARAAQTPKSSAVHHCLAITLCPACKPLKVRDRIRVPGALVTAPFTISLNADLAVQAVPGGLKLAAINSRVRGASSGIDRDDHDPAFRVPVTVYRVDGATPGQELTGELE